MTPSALTMRINEDIDPDAPEPEAQEPGAKGPAAQEL